MFPLKDKGPYVCVHCGYNENKTVYKIYGNKSSSSEESSPSKCKLPAAHLKLTECPKCQQFVDEYVELDNCILFLDAVLLKQSFFRHILLNCTINKKIPLKLGTVYSLCDAYRIWSLSLGLNPAHQPQQPSSSHLTYMQLELSFYLIFSRTILENLILWFLLYMLVRFVVPFLLSDNLFPPTASEYHILRSLIICSYGRIFSLPAVLWCTELNPVIDWFLTAFHLISLAQCCRIKSLDLYRGKDAFLKSKNEYIRRLLWISLVGSAFLLQHLIIDNLVRTYINYSLIQ